MSGYEVAAAVLPGETRRCALALPEDVKRRTREFRLRLGRAPSVLCGEEERDLAKRPVERADLTRLLEIATRASPYASAAGMEKGFVTAPGGVRIGLCGVKSALPGGEWTYSGITSAAIRVPREILGCGADMCCFPMVSTLIVSPPGRGKTTLLRDMVRCYSDRGVRVGLCDERCEIAAFSSDGAGYDVGERTDVLSACGKHTAAMQLLRTMNPQMIAMDEITEEADADACRQAAGCGVVLLASAHGESGAGTVQSALIRSLIGEGVFRRIIHIRTSESRWAYEEERLC